MTSTLHQVKDLSPEQKHAAEILLGHAVSEEESASIKSIHASKIIASKLTADERIEALRSLNARFADTPRPSVNAEEEEAAVNEAMCSSGPIPGATPRDERF